MTFPLLPAHEVGLALAVLVGFAFGFVLERAGFGRAPKLVGQFYGYDLTVFKVMFGAIVTAMLGLVVASALGLADFEGVADRAASGTFLLPMVAGGFLLGAGFIVSGYCPGTSFVAMASGKLDGLATVVGVVVGQVLWAELEWRPGFAAFQNGGDLGNVYLWELLHLPAGAGPAVVAVAVTVMAIGCFAGAERVERALSARADPAARATPGGRAGRWVFAGFATAAALGLVGLALPRGAQAGTRPAARIAPQELARRVVEEPWRLRVLDLRPAAACAARRVPGASCVPAAALAALRLGDAAAPGPAPGPGGPDLVLVGEGDEVPAAALAYPGRVLALEGGWKAWEAFALAPPAPPAAGAGPAELDAYRLRAGLQAALTGTKAAPPPPAPTLAPGAAPKRAGGGGGCSG